MADLPKRKLGRTGLDVTALGFGALELRGMIAGVGRELKPRQSERILNAVLDALARETASDPGISHLLTQLIPHALTNQNGHREMV